MMKKQKLQSPIVMNVEIHVYLFAC